MKHHNIFTKSKTACNWISITIFHFLVTIIFTFPSIALLKSHFIGGPGGDKFQFIWNFWWVKYSLFDLNKLPLFCDMQYYPTGVSLALHDNSYFWSFLSIPFQLFLDPGMILNIFLLLCFPLNGLAFYHLGNEITGDHRGALTGSLIFAYCPYLIGRFHVCHIQYTGVFLIPLFLLELWRYSQFFKTVNIIKAGIYFSLTSLISYYYGAALALITIVFFIYMSLFSKKRRIEMLSLKRFFRQALIVSLLILVILSPFITPALLQLKRGDYPLIKEPFNTIEENSGDLVSYIIPDTTLALWKGWGLSPRLSGWAGNFNNSIFGNLLEKSVYSGWVSLLAVILAIFSQSIRKEAWPWLVLSLSFWIISLGPTLFINGKPYLNNCLPYRFLAMIPLFDIMRAPTRFVFFITLGSGMLVAIVIERVRKNLTIRVFRIITIFIILFILAEFLPVSTYVTPKNILISRFYHDIQKDQDKGSVLNIPVDFTGATGGGDIFVYAQTIHQKPIIGGYVSREPGYALGTLYRYPFLKAISRDPHDKAHGLSLTAEGFKNMEDTLKDLDIGYVILQKALLTFDEFTKVIKWIEPGLGRPIFEDEWLRAYRF